MKIPMPDAPLCTQCTFRKKNGKPEFAKCTHLSSLNDGDLRAEVLATGKIRRKILYHFHYCAVMRRGFAETHCGESGKYFQQALPAPWKSKLRSLFLRFTQRSDHE